MPHFMIVLIIYINLLNLSWIKKMSFLRNMEPLKVLTESLFLHSNDELFHSLTVEGEKRNCSTEVCVFELFECHWNCVNCILREYYLKEELVSKRDSKFLRKFTKNTVVNFIRTCGFSCFEKFKN